MRQRIFYLDGIPNQTFGFQRYIGNMFSSNWHLLSCCPIRLIYLPPIVCCSFSVLLGIPVKIPLMNYHMHLKTAIIDGRKIISGSANWTAQSMGRIFYFMRCPRIITKIIFVSSKRWRHYKFNYNRSLHSSPIVFLYVKCLQVCVAIGKI